MEPVVRKFDSFEEMNAADIEAQISLTPQERVRHFIQLQRQFRGCWEHHPEDAEPRVNRHVVRKRIDSDDD